MNILHSLALLPLLAFTAHTQAACNSALPSNTPTERFMPVDEAYLVDRATGLMWARCAHGSTWQNEGCSAPAPTTPASFTWQQALQTADSATDGGFTDWRVPNVKELESIIERKCWAPAIALALFPNTPSALFWTSSPNVVRPDVAMVVDFDKGAHRSLKKNEPAQLRLVRNFVSGQ